MWLKLVIAVAIVAFCTGMGYLAASRYRVRKKFYAQFYAFNERYLNELEFSRRPLTAFLDEVPYTGEFNRALQNFKEKKEIKTGAFLTKEERADCADYFAALGRGDALSQRNAFAARRKALEEKKQTSEKEAKTRGQLYLKLGLLAGLAIVILII